MKGYQEQIREAIERAGRKGIDPRHVEAYIRLAHSTLDGLSEWGLSQEIKVGVMCVDADGAENAERLAQSFGL